MRDRDSFLSGLTERERNLWEKYFIGKPEEMSVEQWHKKKELDYIKPERWNLDSI